MPRTLIHQVQTTIPVIRARIAALIPLCLTEPDAYALAEAVDGLVEDADPYLADGEAAFWPSGVATDELANVEADAAQSCGDEPDGGRTVRCAIHGIYRDDGDAEAWDRWMEDVDAAKATAVRQFRADTQATLRTLDRLLAAYAEAARRRPVEPEYDPADDAWDRAERAALDRDVKRAEAAMMADERRAAA